MLSARITRVFVLHADPQVHGEHEVAVWAGAGLTTGACYSKWMSGQRGMTLEFVFGEFMVFYGFAGSEVAEQAVAEFARIDACGWARAMCPTSTCPDVFWRAA